MTRLLSLPALGPWLVASGLLLNGAAFLHPRLAPAGFLAIALLAVGLQAATRLRPLLPALLLGGLVANALAFPWQFGGATFYLPGWPAIGLAWLGYGGLLMTLPKALALGGAWALARRVGASALLWLPPAWLAGEALQMALSGATYDAWLYAQWQTPFMLRALSHLGWEGAVLLAWGAASAGGLALARRSWRLGLVALGLAAGLGGLPPVPEAGADALRDVGAVHLASYFHPPKAAPGVRLLVWPEEATNRHPRLGEGSLGTRVAPPFPSRETAHLLGLTTRVPEGPQNSLLALGPQGEVTGLRAKRLLFPGFEGPLFGVPVPGRPGFVPGRAPALLRAGGRQVLALVCFEALDRGLVREALALGEPELLAIAAGDMILDRHPAAQRQFLAVAVLRAVEFRLPVARASFLGSAALIAADGRVLARSRPGTDGVLTLLEPRTGSAAGPARDTL